MGSYDQALVEEVYYSLLSPKQKAELRKAGSFEEMSERGLSEYFTPIGQSLFCIVTGGNKESGRDLEPIERALMKLLTFRYNNEQYRNVI